MSNQSTLNLFIRIDALMKELRSSEDAANERGRASLTALERGCAYAEADALAAVQHRISKLLYVADEFGFVGPPVGTIPDSIPLDEQELDRR